MQLLPMASSPDGLISAPVCGHHEDPRLGGACFGGGGLGGGPAPPPPEGTLGYCTGAQEAISTKAQKEIGLGSRL